MGFNNRLAVALMLAAASLGMAPNVATKVQTSPSLQAATDGANNRASPAAPAQGQALSLKQLFRGSMKSYRAQKPTYQSAGWSVAEGKRRAKKARNVRRHKANCKGKRA